jgi:hypothetical protein
MSEYRPEKLERAQEPVSVDDPYMFQSVEESFIPRAADISGRTWSNYFERIPDGVVVLSDPTGLPMDSRNGRKSWDEIVQLMEQTDQLERFRKKFRGSGDIEKHLREGFEGVESSAGVTPWTYEEELSSFDQILSQAAPDRLGDTSSVIPEIQAYLSDMENGRNEYLPDINYTVWTGETYGEENAVAHSIPESHVLYQKSFQLMNQKLLENGF